MGEPKVVKEPMTDRGGKGRGRAVSRRSKKSGPQRPASAKAGSCQKGTTKASRNATLDMFEVSHR